MKSRFLALLFIFAMGASIVPVASAEGFDTKSAAPANPLVTMLPASDAVVAFDPKRFFNEALPKVLASNQPMLSRVVGHVEEFTAKSGIDVRKFDSVAIGASMKPVDNKNLDVDIVAILRGEMSASGLVAVAKLASKGSYREVKIGELPVYVFSVKNAVKKAKAPSANAKPASALDRAFDKMLSEIAVTSTDGNTLVIGSLARVTQTLEKKTPLSPELSSLLNERSTSILSFAAQMPAGIAAAIPLDMDEVSKQISAIRVASGGIDMTNDGALIGMVVRTHRAEQAKNLSDMMTGLRELFGPILTRSKRTDQQLYGRLVSNAKIGFRGSEVTLDLTIPQADLSALGASIK